MAPTGPVCGDAQGVGTLPPAVVLSAATRIPKPRAGKMGDIVNLHGRSSPLEDDELVENLARFADGTLSEAAVKSRHRLTEEEWSALGTDDELVRRISDRKLQRIRGGQTKRERAQIEVADAAPILGKLMRSPDSNARHVIDSVKTL